MKGIVSNCKGFQWDDGNSDKNWYSHQVTNRECEELFFNRPFIVRSDSAHAQSEERYYGLGRTDRDRWLFVAFTVRGDLVRVISARDMNRRETRIYAEKIKRHTAF
ncbi:MAG: BrnT family toxin [Anaerolineae bacterium]|nr:BrnT family toxin [Anaerolineae bacterium]